MSATHLTTERFIEKFMFSNRKLILSVLTVVFYFLSTQTIQVSVKWCRAITNLLTIIKLTKVN
jgi:hypothetical protein